MAGNTERALLFAFWSFIPSCVCLIHMSCLNQHTPSPPLSHTQHANQDTSSPLYRTTSVRFVLITPSPLLPEPVNVCVKKVSSGLLQTLLHQPAPVRPWLRFFFFLITFITWKVFWSIFLTVLCHLFISLAPPSAPRDLTSMTLPGEGKLQLFWSPPLVTGGRSDLMYTVVCKLCDEASCIPCGEKIRFEPGPTDLQDPTVVVSDLDSHLNYTFTVEAQSGVSQFSAERPTATITTALDYTGELFFFEHWLYMIIVLGLYVWQPLLYGKHCNVTYSVILMTYSQKVIFHISSERRGIQVPKPKSRVKRVTNFGAIFM